jgi:hypothetical protein
MNKQIILVKGVSLSEFDIISEQVNSSLEKGLTRFCVYASNLEAEIDIIEIPDTEEKPMTIHNTYMGMQENDLRGLIIKVMREMLRDE